MNIFSKCLPFMASWTALITLLPTAPAFSEEVMVTVGESRYVNVPIGATADQRNPLKTVIEIDIPESVTTIGQALNYLLKTQGYSLTTNEASNSEQYLLLILPLPQTLRHIGPMTLYEALEVMGGEAFQVHVNPVTRSISFRLKKDYLEFIDAEQVKAAKITWKETNAVIMPGEKNTENITKLINHDDVYGPVQQGETLSAIATTLKAQGLSLNQMLVELFKENPHAFGNANLNHLLAGTTLRIPPFAEREALSPQAANSVVKEHNRIWLQRREVQ